MNWLAPALLLIVVSWVASWLIFSQDSIQQQMRDLTSKAIEKQIEKSHMSADQAEQVRAAGEKFGSIGVTVSAYAGPVVLAMISPFWWGLIIWLAGAKVMKGQFGYMKAVEVAGLANMIGVLDTVIRTLLIFLTGNLYTAPSLMLLVKDFDPQSTSHAFLSLVNIMTFWVLAVRSLGLARLAGVGFAKAAMWVFGFWLAWSSLLIGFGAAMKAVFKQ